MPSFISVAAGDGISGYIGPQGPLVGVFLSNAVPSSGAPAALDFSSGGFGTDFATLSPLLGQVFYIGDGKTSGGIFQTFTAPAGATRLFLGIPDGSAAAAPDVPATSGGQPLPRRPRPPVGIAGKCADPRRRAARESAAP